MSYGGMTGYTAGIIDGKINSASEYLKICIKAFGCCFEQREEPLYSPIRMPSLDDCKYYERELKKVEERVKEFDGLSNDEIFERFIDEKKAEISYLENFIARMKKERDLYLKIRNGVEKWVPPTSDHDDIKRFAINQIDMCIPTDSEIREKERELEGAKKAMDIYTQNDADGWHSEYRRSLMKDVDYYTNRLEESKKTVEKRTEYLQAFIDSLESLED